MTKFTEKLRKIIIGLVEQDCRIQCKYITPSGRTCVIGCLALKAGVTKMALKKLGKDRIETMEAYDVGCRITDKFGLSIDTQRRMQELNDEGSDVKARRQGILSYLDNLPVHTV